METRRKLNKNWREKNPEKWAKIQYKAQKKARMRTPEKIENIKKAVSFITSDGMGITNDKIQANCVYKKNVDYWKRIVVYEMPNSNFYHELEKRQFKVQIIDMESGKEEFDTVNGIELEQKYGIKVNEVLKVYRGKMISL